MKINGEVWVIDKDLKWAVWVEDGKVNHLWR
jgi:hypothetical protein